MDRSHAESNHFGSGPQGAHKVDVFIVLLQLPRCDPCTDFQRAWLVCYFHHPFDKNAWLYPVSASGFRARTRRPPRLTQIRARRESKNRNYTIKAKGQFLVRACAKKAQQWLRYRMTLLCPRFVVFIDAYGASVLCRVNQAAQVLVS